MMNVHEQFWSPVKLSLEIATVAVIIVFFIGIITAFWMTRSTFRGKVVIESILLLPLILPPTVVGFLLIYIFGNQNPIGRLFESIFHTSIMFTWWAALIAAALVAFPLLYQSAKTGFEKFWPTPTDIHPLPTHWASPFTFLEEGVFCRKDDKIKQKTLRTHIGWRVF